MSREWPVEIVADESVTCGAVLWRHRGRQVLTVVVKASFSFAHGGPMLPGAPPPIARADRTFEQQPARSLEIASDLAPYLGRCDVLFRGYAYAQKGQAAPAGAARLAVFRDARPLLDKTIHVFAQPGGSLRAMRSVAASNAEQLFSRMPIVYERAFGGPDVEANPVGVETPNLVDPAGPGRPVGFGPIAPHWPARRRLFGVRRPDPDALPDDLDWAHFQAAPADQQLEHLRGGEWLILDGLHPALARLQTRVPAARGVARLLSPHSRQSAHDPRPGTPIELLADTLWLDPEAHQCTITWRGQIPIAGSTEALSSMVVLAALEAPERPVAWARLAAAAALANPAVASPAASAASPDEAPRSIKHRTMALTAEKLGAVSASAPLPFVNGPPSLRVPLETRSPLPFEVRPNAAPEPRPSTPRTDATPWGPPSVRSMPVASATPRNMTVATPIAIAPMPSLPFSPAPLAPLAPLPPEPPPPGPLETSPPEAERPPPPESGPTPSLPPIAVAPPPLVGPIQPARTTAAASAPDAPAAAARPPGAAAAQPPTAGPPPPAALPPKLGKGNLGAGEVASFLSAFDLPPRRPKA